VGRRRAITVAVALAASAGCTGSPEVGGAEAVRAMVLEACAPGGDAVQTDICSCAYDTLAERFDARALESLDRELRDDPETVPQPVQEAVLECTFEQVAPPTSKPTTTTSSSTTSSSTTSSSTTSTTEPDDEEEDEDEATTTTRRRP
jgi:hypothetical protein